MYHTGPFIASTKRRLESSSGAHAPPVVSVKNISVKLITDSIHKWKLRRDLTLTGNDWIESCDNLQCWNSIVDFLTGCYGHDRVKTDGVSAVNRT